VSGRRLGDDTSGCQNDDQCLAMTASTLCLSVQLAAALVYLYDRLMKRLDTVNHLAISYIVQEKTGRAKIPVTLLNNVTDRTKVNLERISSLTLRNRQRN